MSKVRAASVAEQVKTENSPRMLLQLSSQLYKTGEIDSIRINYSNWRCGDRIRDSIGINLGTYFMCFYRIMGVFREFGGRDQHQKN